MKKWITTFMLLLSCISMVLTGISVEKVQTIIYTVGIILFINCIHLIKWISKVNYRAVTLFQIIIVFGSLICGYTYIILFLPVVIFELFREKWVGFINILISISSLYFTSEMYIGLKEMALIVAILILINLYLFQLKNISEKDYELKKVNKKNVDNSVIMEKKIYELEKYLDQNNIMTVLKERNFIAQKLHDHLGHRITSSIMQLEVTNEMIGKDDEMAKSYLINSMENLREGMEEIRGFLRKVKPSQAVVGIETIKELLLKFQYVSGIETLFICEGDISTIKLLELRIIEENIKEALTNAAKYSNATKITVSIFVFNKFYRVEIRDNGSGSQAIVKGLGLRGIEERLQDINGRVEYYNQDGFVINMVINKRRKDEHKSINM